MKQRILSILLAAALIIGLLPQIALFASAEVYSGTCGAQGDNLTWTLDTATGVLTIEGSGEMENFEYADYTPWYYYDFSEVVISDGVTSIGDLAFSLTGLTDVTIPSSVTSIGYGAFWFCGNLTNVTIPDSVISVGDRAFRRCSSLTNVIIPDSVVSIGDQALYQCESLTSVMVLNPECEIFASENTLGDASTTTIYGYSGSTAEVYANEYGYRFRTYISEGVIGGNCGANGDNVTWTLDLQTKLLTIQGSGEMKNFVNYYDDAPWYDCNISEVVIGNGVTSIGNYAFYWCESLTSVTIPDSVASIGDYAFCFCESLTDVTIPDSVTSIGESAFVGLRSLKDFIVNNNNPAYSSLDGVLFNKEQTALIQYPAGKSGSYTVPDGVTGIGSNAFGHCTGLTGVTIGNSVTSIDDWAFFSCENLTDVTLSNSLTSIGERAFTSCFSLTGVIIPNSVTKIDEYAFSNCTSLTDVTIGNGVTSIGRYVFSDCISLTYIIIPASVTSIGYNAFAYCENLAGVAILNPECSIYASTSTLGNLGNTTIIGYQGSTAEAYANKYWYPFVCGSLLAVVDGEVLVGGTCGADGDNLTWTYGTKTRVLTIEGSGDMRNFSELSGDHGYYSDAPWDNFKYGIHEVVIGDGVTSIGDYAFEYCFGLTGVTIPDSVTSIGDEAFTMCDALTDITIPDSVTSIGDEAFYRCDSLTSVTIPDSVTSLGYGAFRECYGLTSVTIGNSVTSISNNAFRGCDSLTNVTIGNGVTSIGNSAFDGCTSLFDVTIPDSVITIEEDAFYGCTSLTNITLGNSVTSIGWAAFGDCYSLTSVMIPDSVTSIGNYAFVRCYGLTSVTIPESVTNIGDDAFRSCTNLNGFIVSNNNPSYSSLDGVLFNKNQSTLIQYPGGKQGSYTIPDSVTNIRYGAFYACSGLTDVTISDSVTIIDYSVFSYCRSLTSVTIPDSVTSIRDSAFNRCESLTSVTIPYSVTSIGYYAFDGCESLTSVTILNPDCEIDFTVVTDGHSNTLGYPGRATIYGYSGSTAEMEAKDWGYAFVSLGEAPLCPGGHTWDEGNITAEATCTESGLMTYTCTVCGETKTEVIPVTSHNYVAAVTAPTCTEQGYTTHTCSYCGDSYVDSYVKALGHDFGAWTTTQEPTCTEKGEEARTCSRCDATETREADTLGHAWDDGIVTVEPTEDEDGVRTYTCTRCGEAKTAIIPSFSHVHNYIETVTPPTCTEQGYTAHVCDYCGDSYVDSYVDALGHNFVDGVCTRCDANDPNASTKPDIAFEDVPAGAYYEMPVAWAVENGITTGTSATTFRPENLCTRAQIVTFLWRAYGSPTPKTNNNPFADVKKGAYYYDAVLWAVEKGITTGTSANRFGVNDTCTRAQAVTFQWRAAGKPTPETTTNKFVDVKDSAYFYNAVLWAVENGITSGTTATTFRPDNGCTRAQIVTFLYRDMAK